MSLLYREKTVPAQELVSGVESFEFLYYMYDSKEQKYSWVNSWDMEEFPLAVRATVTVLYEEKRYSFTKTIDLFVAKEKKS